MKTLKYILIILIHVSLFYSCEDVIPLDINMGKEFIVIEGQITDQPGPHTVKITRNAPYFNEGPTPRISDAIVIINDVEGDPEAGNSFTLTQTSPGIYQTDPTYQGETGKTYYLNVKIDGTTYTAEDFLAPVEIIDSIQVKLSNSYDELFGVFLFGNETPGIGDYYRFDIYIDDELLDDVQYQVVVDDKFVDGNYIHDFEIYNDKWFHFDEKEKAKLTTGAEVFITSNSLSQEAYEFFLQLQSAGTNTGLMFEPPPANPVGNIQNGAYGIFYASAISTTPTVIVPEIDPEND